MITNPPNGMTTLNFGPPGKQLYGVYHTPQPGQELESGVLLCNPWGQEYVRAHRAVLQLATRLARQGFPVLRFDYFGSGDSSGADEDGTLAQWQADVRAAIQELKRRARVESVYLAGLRLGATLAAQVASTRDDVDGLVLWEPAVLGEEYVQDLTAWHAEKEGYYLNRVRHIDDQPEMLGFRLHPGLLDELRQVNLLELKRRPAARVLLLENALENQPPRESLARLRAHLQTLGAQTGFERLESFKMWAEDPDKGLVPQQILEAAVTWLTQEAGL